MCHQICLSMLSSQLSNHEMSLNSNDVMSHNLFAHHMYHLKDLTSNDLFTFFVGMSMELPPRGSRWDQVPTTVLAIDAECSITSEMESIVGRAFMRT